jgi:hypothetical protein
MPDSIRNDSACVSPAWLHSFRIFIKLQHLLHQSEES